MLFYIAGIVGNLLIGYYLFGFLLICSSIYTLLLFVRRKEWPTFSKQTLGTLIRFSVIILFALMISAYHAKDLAVMDFYSFYARALKTMVLQHGLYLSAGQGLLGNFISYPPFYLLYWYIPFGLTQQIDIAGIAFLNTVSLYVFLLPFVEDWFAKRSPLRYGALAVAAMLPLIYQVCLPYTSLFLDAPMGMLFGFLLCSFFFLPKDSFSRITVCLASAALALMKPSGIFLAVIGSIVILANLWQDSRLSAPSSNRRVVRFVFPVVLLLVPIISYGSWSFLIQNAGLANSYTQNAVLNLLQLFSAPTADQMQGVRSLIYEFLRLFSLPFSNQPSLFVVLLSLSVFTGILFYFHKERPSRRKIILNIVLFSLSFACFVAGLFYTAIFIFSVEQYTLASFERYCSSFLIGYFFLLCISVFSVLSNNANTTDTKPIRREQNPVIATVLVVLMLIVTSFPGGLLYSESSPIGFLAYQHKHSAFFYNSYNTSSITKDSEEAIFIEQVSKQPANSKVCVLTSTLNTSFYYIEFIQFPNICRGGVLSDYSHLAEVVHHVYITESPSDLLNRLRLEADFVYLMSVDDTMIDQYGEMFESPEEIKERTLYQVKTNGDSTVLVRVS